MYKELAGIHAQYCIYPDTLMSKDVDRTIIDRIDKYYELKYLSNFYRNYMNEYNNLIFGKNLLLSRGNLTGAARSVDMPYMGSNVLYNNKAKYMFVFEGSLHEDYQLSITVLACFWIYESTLKYKRLINT